MAIAIAKTPVANAELRALIFQNQGNFPHALSLKRSRWPPIFFAFLIQGTHYLTTVKFKKKSIDSKIFARTSLTINNSNRTITRQSTYALLIAQCRPMKLSQVGNFKSPVGDYNSIFLVLCWQHGWHDLRFLRFWKRRGGRKWINTPFTFRKKKICQPGSWWLRILGN